MLTLGSLFDGIGGWQLAAVHAGVKPIWSSEIEKFPLAVTRKRFPDTKQLGDVTKITDVEPVDIVCAGSPCQDLSIAGKREGLAGERSGLFINAINIVRQMRMSTGGKQPRFFVWENVPGAFTSGSERGADFRAVLESIAETDIPMPKDGRWATAGMVQCPKCEIAWRVLDAQYWGVPQRRKRIFLVADFAATDRRAGKILFVEPSLSRDTAEGEGTGQEATGNVGESVDSASRNCAVYESYPSDCRVKSVHENQQGEVWETNKFAALSTGGGKPGQGYPCVACYDISHRQDVIRPQEKGTLPCLTARAGTGGNNLPVVHSYCIAGNTIDRQPKNGGNGIGNQEELSYTLNTVDRPAVAECFPQNAYDKFLQGTPLATLKACGGSYGGGSENLMVNISPSVGKVRRLTPIECERLQGWPDGYTDVPLNGKPASDANRYKALGNGMAQPCADYVIQRIVDEVGKT